MEETSEKCVNEDGQRTKTGRRRSRSLLPVLVHLVCYRARQLLAGTVQNTGFSLGWGGGGGQCYNLSDVRSDQLPGKDARCRFTGADRMFNRARTRWFLHQNTSTGFKNHLLSSRAATSSGPAEAVHSTQTLYTPTQAPLLCIQAKRFEKRQAKMGGAGSRYM